MSIAWLDALHDQVGHFSTGGAAKNGVVLGQAPQAPHAPHENNKSMKKNFSERWGSNEKDDCPEQEHHEEQGQGKGPHGPLPSKAEGEDKEQGNKTLAQERANYKDENKNLVQGGSKGKSLLEDKPKDQRSKGKSQGCQGQEVYGGSKETSPKPKVQVSQAGKEDKVAKLYDALMAKFGHELGKLSVGKHLCCGDCWHYETDICKRWRKKVDQYTEACKDFGLESGVWWQEKPSNLYVVATY